ncbi:hypothetical protein AAFF_G00153910 [Aldrovandia affinis]|uniref:Gem-associated protein 2 n=1 Tax=Aldrovandia affinis TaxID=143900 RepID=A0AAD7T0F2_9TELE|nr:hypothetical protein AAFF_G00153910 [Aldrovandia affinis]
MLQCCKGVFIFLSTEASGCGASRSANICRISRGAQFATPSLRDSNDPGLDYVKVGFPPFLSITSRLNQASVSSVLEYLINWFGEREFVPQLGRWLYALLACLEKPLLPEAHSLIRQLARRCSEVRANLETKEDETLSALNLMICLVARYFEQNDLADED